MSACARNRLFFQHALKDQFRAVIERTLGRRTVAFISGIDSRHDVAIEVFALSPRRTRHIRLTLPTRVTSKPGSAGRGWALCSVLLAILVCASGARATAPYLPKLPPLTTPWTQSVSTVAPLPDYPVRSSSAPTG